MQIVSAREFRTNQGRYLTAARRGQQVIMTSRYGNFLITPAENDDSHDRTTHILKSLEEVKLVEKGVLPSKSAKDFLNEL